MCESRVEMIDLQMKLQHSKNELRRSELMLLFSHAIMITTIFVIFSPTVRFYRNVLPYPNVAFVVVTLLVIIGLPPLRDIVGLKFRSPSWWESLCRSWKTAAW